jgi:hypothetical protein
MMNDDECGAIGGMTDQSTGRKPAPVPLCPQQIPHDLIQALVKRRKNSKTYKRTENGDQSISVMMVYLKFNTGSNNG